MKHADSWMSQYLLTLRTKITPVLPSALYTRVKIAILDSGFDVEDPYIAGAYHSGRIKGFRTFVGKWKDVVQEKQKVRYVNDTFGHGTHALALLLKTSLDAEVYVAKVTKNGTLDDAQCVADVSEYNLISILKNMYCTSSYPKR